MTAAVQAAVMTNAISSRRDRVTGQASSATMSARQIPASERSALALSVRSQVNSGSVRPK